MADRVVIHVSVPDFASGDMRLHRMAGLLSNLETIVVATAPADADQVAAELTFTISDAVKLAEAVLGGERRAVTTPGLARRLSAFALVLFRVCHAANALQNIGGFDERDDGGDRATAAGDEPDA